MVSMFLSIGEVVILCPWILWGFLFVLLNYIKATKRIAIFVASDITTVFLLFSIQRLVELLFNVDLGVLVLIGAVVLAIIMVLYDWKTKDDLDLSKLLKRIWRIFFVLLTSLYMLALLIFFVLWIIELVKSV